MLIKLYQRFITEKFFNKILLLYTLILIITLTALAIIIMQNFTVNSSTEAVNYNMKVVQDVKNFMDQKMDKVKLILQQLYLNKDQFSSFADFSDVFILLNEKNIDKSSFDYITKVKNTNKYMQYSCLLDDDILDTMLLNISDLSYYHYTVRSSFSYQAVNPDIMALVDSVSKNKKDTKAIPAISIYEPSSKTISKKDMFSVAKYIKSLDFSRDMGILLVNFKRNSIQTAYDHNNTRFSSNVMVFTRDGTIIFDSSEKYYDKSFPFFEEIKRTSSFP